MNPIILSWRNPLLNCKIFLSMEEHVQAWIKSKLGRLVYTRNLASNAWELYWKVGPNVEEQVQKNNVLKLKVSWTGFDRFPLLSYQVFQAIVKPIPLSRIIGQERHTYGANVSSLHIFAEGSIIVVDELGKEAVPPAHDLDVD